MGIISQDYNYCIRWRRYAIGPLVCMSREHNKRIHFHNSSVSYGPPTHVVAASKWKSKEHIEIRPPKAARWKLVCEHVHVSSYNRPWVSLWLCPKSKTGSSEGRIFSCIFFPPRMISHPAQLDRMWFPNFRKTIHLCYLVVLNVLNKNRWRKKVAWYTF